MNSAFKILCLATLALGLGGQIFPCFAQSVSINVEAPELPVKLLNPDGSLNQTPTTCSESQAFSGYLTPGAAALIAETRCRAALLDGAAYNLKISPLLTELNTNEDRPDYRPIAQGLSLITVVKQEEAAPDSLSANPGSTENPLQAKNQMNVTLELVPQYQDLSAAIRAGVADPDFLYLQGQALAFEKESLTAIEQLLPQIMNGEPLNKQINPWLNRLAALASCRQFLEPPQSARPEPAKVQQIEEAMTKAARLDPNNPLIFCILGNNQLGSGRAAQAVASFSQALKSAPDFLPALSGRGTAYLRLNLLDLALNDFNRAIELAPDRADYYMARASVSLIREDFPAMCQDFRAACGKGKCEGFNWAVNNNYCQ